MDTLFKPSPPMAGCLGIVPESDVTGHNQDWSALHPNLKEIVWQKEAGPSLPASKPVSKLQVKQPVVLGQKFVGGFLTLL